MPSHITDADRLLIARAMYSVLRLLRPEIYSGITYEHAGDEQKSNIALAIRSIEDLDNLSMKQ